MNPTLKLYLIGIPIVLAIIWVTGLRQLWEIPLCLSVYSADFWFVKYQDKLKKRIDSDS